MGRCRDIWVDDIVMVQQTDCDGASGACVTYNTFSAVVYNEEDGCTYDWSTSIGTTPGGHTGKICDIWITSDQNETFTVTLTVTCGALISTKSEDFISKNRL